MSDAAPALALHVERDLTRALADRQASWRVPGLLAGIVRDGQLAWVHGVGAADLDRPQAPPDADTQYRIGSITKTFTAVLVMALRDEGKLSLDDPLSSVIPETRHGALSIRAMLAHASGLQREPVGEIWESLQCPDLTALLKGMDEAEQVLPHRRAWHYSNLAYAVLGEVVARLDGRSWADSLRARILEPLDMRRTDLVASPPAAVGYYVDPFTDQAHAETDIDLQATEPCGGLWSTAEDLSRWAAFLAEPDEKVLAADTVEEMTSPEIMADADRWTLAWGLGLELFRSGDRVFVGHTGGMPGHLTALVIRRWDKIASMVLANTSSTADPGALAIELAERVLDDDPRLPTPWRPGPPVPEDLTSLVGRWWSEGSAYEFSVRGGRLEARADGQPDHKPPAVFERVTAELYRTVSGRERAEQLRVVRDEDGTAVRMYWATYPFSRQPETFGAPR